MKSLLQHNETARMALALVLSVIAHIAILSLYLYLSASSATHQTGGTGKTLSVTFNRVSTTGLQTSQSTTKQTTVQNPIATPQSPSEKTTAPPDTAYFNPNELDQLPNTDKHQLAFNPSDPPKQIDIVMRLWIDKSGKVVKVEPVTAELSQTFISEARSHLMNSRFSPGHRLGYPANSVIDITLHYE